MKKKEIYNLVSDQIENYFRQATEENIDVLKLDPNDEFALHIKKRLDLLTEKTIQDLKNTGYDIAVYELRLCKETDENPEDIIEALCYDICEDYLGVGLNGN
jgi:hypothetical protein